jgi:hypothetical protein
LDAATGKVLWRQTTGCWYQVSTPSLENGRVYLLSTPEDRPVATCHDGQTGKVIWRRELPKPAQTRSYGHAGSPLLWQGLMILNVAGGVALKQDTGEIAWQHEGRAGLATPVLYQENGKPRVLVFGGEALVAREARTGQALWSIPWKTELAVNACDPIFDDGKVFISSTYGKQAALFEMRDVGNVSGQQPAPRWKTRQHVQQRLPARPEALLLRGRQFLVSGLRDRRRALVRRVRQGLGAAHRRQARPPPRRRRTPRWRLVTRRVHAGAAAHGPAGHELDASGLCRWETLRSQQGRPGHLSSDRRLA